MAFCCLKSLSLMKTKKGKEVKQSFSIKTFKFNKEIVGVNSPFPYSVGKPAPGSHRCLQYLRLLA